MKRIWLAALAALAAANVTACGAGADAAAVSANATTTSPSTTTRSAPSTSSPPAPSTPATNARGNLVKQIGDLAAMGDTATGAPSLEFTVDEVIPDIPCTADYYDYTPENGRLIGVRVSVQTMDLSNFGGTYSFEAKDFSYIGADGVTLTNIYTLPAYACLDLEPEEFSQDPMGPGQRYTGIIVLDVPATTGTLIYAPIYVDGGWEWSF